MGEDLKRSKKFYCVYIVLHFGICRISFSLVIPIPFFFTIIVHPLIPRSTVSNFQRQRRELRTALQAPRV
ncbi:unnamed protein product [Citrullus colocynthis]|uniref:Transmembrane protein n=1 Tax=Citrullus colocynthis TaxID=252529 RepID=A0ABP0Z5R1_9ROSI